MDLAILVQVVHELAEYLPGARVDKITQGKEGGFYLHLHRRHSRPVLLMSPDRHLPRIHLVSRKPEAVTSPAGFVLSLRKYLNSARVGPVRIINDDRVVEIGFLRPGRMVRLIFELTGAAANLILTDADGGILSVLRPEGPGSGARRVLLPGAQYEPPRLRPGPIARTGAYEVVPDANGGAATPVNRAAELLFDRFVEDRETLLLRQTLQGAVRQALARSERRAAAIAEDLARAEKAEEYQLTGKMILANLDRLNKGMDRTELTGHDGRTLTVVLDPSKTPTENAEAYFRRSKKGKAALSRVRERLDDAHEEADVLRLALEDIPRAPDRLALVRLRERLIRYGLLRERPTAVSLRARPASPSYRTIPFEGWDILVGKNAAGNDHITRALARPDDLWLHAEGMPGSHVVVRNPDKREIPHEVLRKAASLAAYFSKGKGSTKVPVAYTEARFVKKPKGAKAGLAVLDERKTIMAVPEPA